MSRTNIIKKKVWRIKHKTLVFKDPVSYHWALMIYKEKYEIK